MATITYSTSYSDLLVNQHTTGVQSNVNLSGSADGGYAAAYLSDDGYVRVDVYDADGAVVFSYSSQNSGAADPTVELGLGTPSVVQLSNGNYVVSWLQADENNVSTVVLGPSGTPLIDISNLDTGVGGHNTADLIALPDGAFAVTSSAPGVLPAIMIYDSGLGLTETLVGLGEDLQNIRLAALAGGGIAAIATRVVGG